MKTRVLSAVALLPILLVIVLVLPAWATATLFAAAGAVAAYELLYRTGLVKNRRLVIYAMVMAVLVAFWSLRQDVNLAAIGLLAYLCLLLGEMLLAHAKLRFEKICLCMAAGVLLPYLLYPVGGFFSGLFLGRRHGLCLLYPAEGGLLCLVTVFLLYNYTALFHCLLFTLPALAGNLAGSALRRRKPFPGKEDFP